MPYTPELDTNNGLAFPLSLPGNHSAYNPFNAVNNSVYYSRPGPASPGMYKPFSGGSMETLVATSPADLFKLPQMPWNEATPALSQTSETNSTCSPSMDYVLSPGSSAGYGAYNIINHAGSRKMKGRSFSVASDDTVTPSFNSGATPLALVAPLSEIESCLFGETAPACVKTEDLLVDLVDSVAPTAVIEEARAPLQEGEGRTRSARKRTYNEVRTLNSSMKISADRFVNSPPP
jgi:hypothetical protein